MDEGFLFAAERPTLISGDPIFSELDAVLGRVISPSTATSFIFFGFGEDAIASFFAFFGHILFVALDVALYEHRVSKGISLFGGSIRLDL